MTATPNEIGKLRTLLNERADFYARPSDKKVFTRAFTRFDMDLIRAYERLYSQAVTAREIENAVDLLDRFAVRSMADSLEIEHMDALRLVMRAAYLHRVSTPDVERAVEEPARLYFNVICHPERADEIAGIITERRVLNVTEIEEILAQNKTVHTRLREGTL